MKLKQLLFIVSIFFGAFNLQAQQDAEYSMYMFNGLYLNPAYAGAKEGPTIMAIYRHQWSQIEGAPRSFNISGHSPFKRDQYALGGTLHYDQIGPEKKYKADIDFAFRIQVKNPDNKISFGVRTGLLFYHVQPENYRPLSTYPLDPTLEENYKTYIPNFGFGIHAYGKRYYVGIGLPHLLNMSLKNAGEVVFNDEDSRQFRHVFVTAGGVIGKEFGKVKVKPSVLYKYASNAPWDFDVNLSFLFIDRLWLGASYRTGGDYDNRRGESIIGMLMFKATQQLEIGYAYDHTLSRLGDFNTGTHEVMIGFDFGQNKKQFVTPRYIRYF
ncbi:MAG: type IX secretion system membrane protein PorP/SprF [Bacteroidetes bacterium]|nr:type IX secretion system membrane protein PorP/SprF [Bacteroidota bacterium]